MTVRSDVLEILGVLSGWALVILGICLLLYWVIGTWMGSVPVLAAAVACMVVGMFTTWYFSVE